jgi:hypothetical protein
MNRDEKLLYDAAISEVRGEEDAGQKIMLEEDPYAWRTALRQVIDEIDSQKEFKKEALETTKELQGIDSRAYIIGKEEFIKWQEKVGVFRKYISARLTHVDRICKESPSGINSAPSIDITDLERLKGFVRSIDDVDEEDDAWFDGVDDLMGFVRSL